MGDDRRDLSHKVPKEQEREDVDVPSEIPVPDETFDEDTLRLNNDETDFTTDETSSAIISSEEAEPYFPPTDPVIEPKANDEGGADVLGGFSSGNDESLLSDYDEDQILEVPDDELTQRVIDTLRRDATTADLDIDVYARDGVVILRGRVPTIMDAENAESVASNVPGVIEVREELEVDTQ
ncbi:transport-associated [Thermobaculum terrenum ATCC BAA-798]|uniref:Transport-associated n=1 Tax=Thermobaculum terrenum (strain ATCC BAA-798 / CCMEE 7001 / YNP1) TaxID=525904 RepID=D1CG65_THET1|nr:BON domain-containing protein [Thermobaculum terrenum]ACZ41921.1 transport-associated [Thermobaculum terrenum ATCC BAA-798]